MLSINRRHDSAIMEENKASGSTQDVLIDVVSWLVLQRIIRGPTPTNISMPEELHPFTKLAPIEAFS
jgi:hypothetical protein